MIRSLSLLCLTSLVLLLPPQLSQARGGDIDPVSVRVSPVTVNGDVSARLRFAGIVQARQRATLTFQVSGTLRERLVELGEQVESGQTLARIYNPGLEPGRDSAQARLDELITQLEQADRELTRSRRLYERGVVSEQKLEQLRARRDSLQASVGTARASLAEARQMVAESALKAPFSGQVEALLVEEGEFVGAGQPVIRLSSPEGKEVEIRVPTYLLKTITVGQKTPVWPVRNRGSEPVSGRVIEIAQAGARRGTLNPVLVALPGESLATGEPVEVGVQPPRRVGKTVPLLSVMKTSSGDSVFVVRDGVAKRVPVTVDRIVGERVAVQSELLEAGDPVVYAGMTRLLDGDPVEVLE